MYEKIPTTRSPNRAALLLILIPVALVLGYLAAV